MQTQACLERVAVTLPAKIERGDRRRHVETAVVPPDVLVVDKEGGHRWRKRQRRCRERPFGSAAECIAAGGPAPAGGRPPKLTLMFSSAMAMPVWPYQSRSGVVNKPLRAPAAEARLSVARNTWPPVSPRPLMAATTPISQLFPSGKPVVAEIDTATASGQRVEMVKECAGGGGDLAGCNRAKRSDELPADERSSPGCWRQARRGRLAAGARCKGHDREHRPRKGHAATPPRDSHRIPTLCTWRHYRLRIN